MPKFLYTVLAGAIIFTGLVIHQIVVVKPDNTIKILIFLLLVFIALSHVLSLAIYFLFYKHAPNFSNLKFLYRKSLKWAVFLSSFIVVSLGLRAFKLFAPLNYALFIILYVMIFQQIRGKR